MCILNLFHFKDGKNIIIEAFKFEFKFMQAACMMKGMLYKPGITPFSHNIYKTSTAILHMIHTSNNDYFSNKYLMNSIFYMKHKC